jgi:hypothetical protein
MNPSAPACWASSASMASAWVMSRSTFAGAGVFLLAFRASPSLPYLCE